MNAAAMIAITGAAPCGACLAAVAALPVIGVAAGVYVVLKEKPWENCADKYGNIMKVETKGASHQTARGDRLGYSGVEASHAMAETDAGRMEEYRDIIKRVARKHDVDPALIAAIISRESRAGANLDEGWGDHRRAWGLMQVDKRWHTPRGEWDSEEHLSHATGILVDLIKDMQRKDAFSDLSKEKQLKGGIAAYNMGDTNVHSYDKVDENTTGGDYSNDVAARAQWYKRNKKY